jgi:hypothetical protein
MNIVSVPPFNAFIMIGLEVGYTSKKTDKMEVIKEIQAFQIKLHEKENILLSTNISESLIVLKGQIEAHLKIEFINYPKSNIPSNKLKNYILEMAKHLMAFFKQNRIVISFPEETVMIEENLDLDPRI